MTVTTRLRPDEDEDEPIGRDRRRTVVIVVLVTALVAVAGIWIVGFSSVFGVRSVQVQGTHVLTAAQVRAAADISNGAPLIRLDTAAATLRVEKLAVVDSAQVRTSFPSTVVITVVERLPVGYIHRGNRDVLVDRTGDQYRTVPTAPAHLPRFVVPSGTDARTTGGAVATVAAALPADLRAKLTSIEALDRSAITLVLTQGRVVNWGSAARSADKARVLPVLLRRHAQHVDVTDPDLPFTR
jgi:cell division protein FtsQ